MNIHCSILRAYRQNVGEEKPFPHPIFFCDSLENGLIFCKSGLPGVLFLLMTILSQSFFTLMSGHLVAFSFLSAWHNVLYYS